MAETNAVPTWDVRTARFSFFKAPVTNKVPSELITIGDAFSYITGTQAREQTSALRSIDDPAEARKFKARKFDYVMFSGSFSYGSDDKLTSHSGLICLDFDHVGDAEAVRGLKATLIADKYFQTQLLFTSPSGDGVKWVLNIDLARCDHRTWFRALQNYVKATYHLEADEKCINVSRACFLPHDAEVYVNPSICPF